MYWKKKVSKHNRDLENTHFHFKIKQFLIFHHLTHRKNLTGVPPLKCLIRANVTHKKIFF